MSAVELQQVEHAWPTMAQVVFVPQNEADYRRLVALLDTLTDTGGEDETHPLASFDADERTWRRVQNRDVEGWVSIRYLAVVEERQP